MLKLNDAKETVLGIVQHDPLFVEIQNTPLEEILYNDNYLAHIEESNHYSIAEVAGWFEITDAMLRYYIKPFEQYIFDNASNSPNTNIRLNLPAILRLRMILLLKDEHRVRGLKLLLGIDDNGQLFKHQITATTMGTDDLANKVDILGNVLQQMIQTGLFNITPNEEHGSLQVTINQDFLAQNIQLVSSESELHVEEIQKTVELKQENENLQKQISELQERSVKDIVQKFVSVISKMKLCQHYGQKHYSNLRWKIRQAFSEKLFVPLKLKWRRSNLCWVIFRST